MASLEVLVVGAGPLGAATSRWLAEAGHSVTVVGPGEPRSHQDLGVPWSAHYDQGRLGAIDAMYVPTVLGVRSMGRFDALARAAGTTFTSPMPLLTTFPEEVKPSADDSVAAWRNLEALMANVVEFGGRADLLDADELAARFPSLCLPTGERAVLQEDALLINPRLLTAVELELAERAGAVRIEDVVTRLQRHDAAGWRVTLAGGETLAADRVVLTVGAYTNASGLLAAVAPAALATTVFGCTIVLLEVEEPDAVDFPGLMFSSEHYGGGLVTPPRRYPDGRWYLKCAGGELVDHPLTTTEEITEWVRSGGSTAEVAWFREYVAQVLPGVSVTGAVTKPCLPTFNVSGLPYIDRVTDGLVLATEGERGVMMADEIGRLAAGLAAEDRWIDPLPSHLFNARWHS